MERLSQWRWGTARFLPGEPDRRGPARGEPERGELERGEPEQGEPAQGATTGSETGWGCAWRDNELKVTFAKEEQQAQTLLLPLDLDGYLSGEYEGPFAARIRERLAVDFIGWDKGPEKFEKQVENVVRALASDAGSE